MALVTVTGNVTDITGKADPDTLVFTTPTIRKNVLSTRDKRVVPDSVTGGFSVQLEAGPATVIVRGKPYKFVAAEGDLWSLIELNLSVPAATAAEKLQAAVSAWAQSFADARYAAKSAVSALSDAVTAKYSLPGSGVPKTDLAAPVRASLDKADASMAKAAADAAYGPRKVFAAASTAASATLAPGAFDQVDASGGSRTRKLAAGAAVDDQITVKVTAITAGNTVTIQGDTGVTASTITLTALNQAVTFSWTGSAWVVSGRDNPTTYLTSTFASINAVQKTTADGTSTPATFAVRLTADGDVDAFVLNGVDL